MQCNAVHCNAVQRSAMQYNAIQYNVMSCTHVTARAEAALGGEDAVPPAGALAASRVAGGVRREHAVGRDLNQLAAHTRPPPHAAREVRERAGLGGEMVHFVTGCPVSTRRHPPTPTGRQACQTSTYHWPPLRATRRRRRRPPRAPRPF